MSQVNLDLLSVIEGGLSAATVLLCVFAVAVALDVIVKFIEHRFRLSKVLTATMGACSCAIFLTDVLKVMGDVTMEAVSHFGALLH